jgi:hypothetical protein
VKRALPDDVLQRLAKLIREYVLDDADTATMEDIAADFIDDDEPITLLAAHLLAELDRTRTNLADAETALGRRIIGGRVRGNSLAALTDAAADMVTAQLATPAPDELEMTRRRVRELEEERYRRESLGVWPAGDRPAKPGHRPERFGGAVGYPD